MYNKIMAQLMICSSRKRHYDSVQNGKPKTYFKKCNDRRHVRKQRVRRKAQQANNEDNISTRSITQQSQSSLSLNTLETITSSTNKTQYYDIDNDNDNMNELLEHRKPTVDERLSRIHISVDQVKKQMAQSSNDDVAMLKSRGDDIELILEKQN